MAVHFVCPTPTQILEGVGRQEAENPAAKDLSR
jgi:hypothetical protein